MPALRPGAVRIVAAPREDRGSLIANDVCIEVLQTDGSWLHLKATRVTIDITADAMLTARVDVLVSEFDVVAASGSWRRETNGP